MINIHIGMLAPMRVTLIAVEVCKAKYSKTLNYPPQIIREVQNAFCSATTGCPI